MNKREFLKKGLLTGVGGVLTFNAFSKIMEEVEHIDPEILATDDDFWTRIRGDYKLKPDYINLENGYYCIMPQPIEQRYLEHVQRINRDGSFYMRKKLNEDRQKVREALAKIANCSVEELVVTRNTTESLDLVIGGYPWEKGDEAIMAEQDYGAMLNMFRLQEDRHGIVAKKVMVPNNPKSDEEIVALYENEITDKTKLIMICHMINITGHVLPVRKICDMAHKHDVEVMVDGAHSFAHVRGSMSELNCDYYGTSLHKWLSAPLGGGMLYIKKDKIEKIWPLFAESKKDRDDINRLNHTGTKPIHSDLGILDAIEYYEKIGAERKEKRLRFIQNYWTGKVREMKGIVLNTPEDPMRSCAIANVGIEGMTAHEMAKILMEKYKIWTVAIKRPGVHGCRITPNVFTTTDELDKLVTALKEMSGN